MLGSHLYGNEVILNWKQDFTNSAYSACIPIKFSLNLSESKKILEHFYPETKIFSFHFLRNNSYSFLGPLKIFIWRSGGKKFVLNLNFDYPLSTSLWAKINLEEKHIFSSPIFGWALALTDFIENYRHAIFWHRFPLKIPQQSSLYRSLWWLQGCSREKKFSYQDREIYY